MRVLVTGADGVVGRALSDALVDDRVVALDHGDLDVTAEPAVVAAVRDHAPDVVVHAAAIDDPVACAADPQGAWQVNAVGAWWVARACVLAEATLVHLSTAEVFDGTLGRPYTEFDPPAPRSVYGRSMAAGEELVRRTTSAHYVVRTGWLLPGERDAVLTALFGPQRHGQAALDDECTGAPTFASDLAPALRRVAVSGRYGTYHLTNAGGATRLEVGRVAAAASGLALTVVPRATDGGADRPVEPERPPYAVLDNLLARLTGVGALPHWCSSLTAVVAGAQP